MRSRLLSVAILGLLVMTTALVSKAAPAQSRPSGKQAVTCGSWRWAVKTLSDGRKRQVAYHPLFRSITFLRDIAGPGGLSSGTPRIPDTAEMRTYRVNVTLIKATIEDDKDIHLVVAAPGHKFRTLI